MTTLQRSSDNPILSPSPDNPWEHDGAFNGCVVFHQGVYHMVYRAFSSPRLQNGVMMQVSTVGYASSTDGIHFGEHRLLFGPTEDWELYGCEDPRITFMDGAFYIFYTALSVFPFAAHGIKLAVAKTTDFNSFEKHPVTPFNSKAMGLFQDKVNGKMAALVTMHTDMPPAKIGVAIFDRESDIWSPQYWSEWYENANDHVLHLLRDMRDQVELGAPPIKTDKGFLAIYSYIKNYMSDNKIFGVEAVLLDLNDPRKILGRTKASLITPDADYELNGIVPNIVFPSGALIKDDKLFVYYGAADTRCAVGMCDLSPLLDEMLSDAPILDIDAENKFISLEKYNGNPIIKPVLEIDWQNQGTFNPAAIYEGEKVHLIYRAQGRDGTSVLGYAMSEDGVRIAEALDDPVYLPREEFEKKTSSQGNSGCEDPRITKIGDRLYMTYTAYDGRNPPRVALTSINASDFLQRKWEWDKPKLISQPGIDDKNACIVKSKDGNSYLAFHRLGDSIWLDVLNNLDFTEREFLAGSLLASPRKDRWDNVKIGIGAPPIETEFGYLLLYHGVSEPGFKYKVGAMILAYDDPFKIISRTDVPILEPTEEYEREGRLPNVVFPCGAVVIDGVLYVYYGCSDTVIGVACVNLNKLLDELIAKNSVKLN